jgi:hypothetical protein
VLFWSIPQPVKLASEKLFWLIPQPIKLASYGVLFRCV